MQSLWPDFPVYGSMHEVNECLTRLVEQLSGFGRRAIRRRFAAKVLRKLTAARGGGFIFISDHSVTSAVPGRTYDSIVRLVRQYGIYPL